MDKRDILFNYLYIAGMKDENLAKLAEFDNVNSTVRNKITNDNLDIKYEIFIENLVDAVLNERNRNVIIDKYLMNSLGYENNRNTQSESIQTGLPDGVSVLGPGREETEVSSKKRKG